MLEAGAASVASLLSSTFWLLAREQRVVQKLRAEILNAVGNERPTYEQLRSLKYVRDVLKEGIVLFIKPYFSTIEANIYVVLRCYPVTPLNIRVANTNTTLPTGGGPDGTSGVFLEKDQAAMFFPAVKLS